MNEKRQISILIAVSLICCTLIVCYGLFYTAPVNVYQVELTSSPTSELKSSEVRHEMSSNSEISVTEEEKINLNSATFFELTSLPGIGEVTANAILAYREENGSFKTIEELMNVSGIGEKKFQDIKPYIMVD